MRRVIWFTCEREGVEVTGFIAVESEDKAKVDDSLKQVMGFIKSFAAEKGRCVIKNVT